VILRNDINLYDSWINSRDLKYPDEPGIYMIKNIVNNKVYIGSSKSIRKRLKGHIAKFHFGNHSNKHLISSINKYGPDAFWVIVLEFCSENELQEREQFYIDYYKSYDRSIGYNHNPFAYSNKGVPVSIETRIKLSLATKGIPKTKEHNLKNSIAHMGSRNPNYGKKLTDKHKEALLKANHRQRGSYTVVSPDGTIISFVGLQKFCNENNLNTACMSLVIRGKQRKHKGWTALK
jgi:group I intron endonuclease